MKNIEIDGETADRITALTLIQHRDWMVESISERYDKMSDEEIGRYTKLIKAANILLEDYFQVPLL